MKACSHQTVKSSWEDFALKYPQILISAHNECFLIKVHIMSQYKQKLRQSPNIISGALAQKQEAGIHTTKFFLCNCKNDKMFL